MKQPVKIKPEYVLCASCGKPIHISELAMISGGHGKINMYHGNMICLMEIL